MIVDIEDDVFDNQDENDDDEVGHDECFFFTFFGRSGAGTSRTSRSNFVCSFFRNLLSKHEGRNGNVRSRRSTDFAHVTTTTALLSTDRVQLGHECDALSTDVTSSSSRRRSSNVDHETAVVEGRTNILPSVDILIENVLDYVSNRDDWNTFCILNQDINNKLSQVDGMNQQANEIDGSATLLAPSLSIPGRRKTYKIPPWPIYNANSEQGDDKKYNNCIDVNSTPRIQNRDIDSISHDDHVDKGTKKQKSTKKKQKKYVISCIALNSPLKEDLLVCGCDDGGIIAYNVRNNQRGPTRISAVDNYCDTATTTATSATYFPPHTGRVRSGTFSPTDPYMLVSSSQDGTIRIYKDMNRILLPSTHHGNFNGYGDNPAYCHGGERNDEKHPVDASRDTWYHCPISSFLLGSHNGGSCTATSPNAPAGGKTQNHRKSLTLANAVTFTPNGRYLVVSNSKVFTQTTIPFARVIQSVLSVWSIQTNTCLYQWNEGYGKSNFSFIKCVGSGGGYPNDDGHHHQVSSPSSSSALFVITSRTTEDHIVRVWDLSNVEVVKASTTLCNENIIHSVDDTKYEKNVSGNAGANSSHLTNKSHGIQDDDELQNTTEDIVRRGQDVMLHVEEDIYDGKSNSDAVNSDLDYDSDYVSSSDSDDDTTGSGAPSSGSIPVSVQLEGGSRETLALAWYKMPDGATSPLPKSVQNSATDGATKDTDERDGNGLDFDDNYDGSGSNPSYYLAVGNWYATIKVWGLPNGKLVQTLGRNVANYGNNSHRPQRQRPSQQRKSTASATWCLEFIQGDITSLYPTPLRLLDGRGDGSIRIWNVDTGACMFHWSNAHRGGLIDLLVPKQPQNHSTYISAGYEGTIGFHLVPTTNR